VQVSAEESGVASEIVQKLIDAERDRVKLVSWSLFHPEALDMHPLESDISERTQVLEVRTTTWSRRRDAMRSLLCPTLERAGLLTPRLLADRTVHHHRAVVRASVAGATAPPRRPYVLPLLAAWACEVWRFD
jgi:hypothetical protein